MKLVLKILLAVAVVVMGYVCYRSIMGPIEFKKERDKREDAIITRLIEIRKAQIEYKNLHKEHAGSFDDLGKFLKEEKLPFLIKEGVLTDEQLESGLTEQEAVKQGLIRRDTFWVIAKDTLFGPSYNVDEMRYVPTTNNRVQFAMDTATITSASGYVVKVFQAGVTYNEYLDGLDRQEIINLNDRANKLEKYPGLRVGSITEINNNAGNWE
ncbi:MAG: cytochrome P450 [Tannerellaceae bacterium]|nr:cytochrome P450 [Tannerellaceae bacterium]